MNKLKVIKEVESVVLRIDIYPDDKVPSILLWRNEDVELEVLKKEYNEQKFKQFSYVAKERYKEIEFANLIDLGRVKKQKEMYDLVDYILEIYHS